MARQVSKLFGDSPKIANQLVASVQAYAQRISGKSLKLVDLTGFSGESISITSSNLAKDSIGKDVWNSEGLFAPGSRDLKKLMGILLEVPELRENLKEATGGSGPDGDKLSRMICDWVAGKTIIQLADSHFSKSGENVVGAEAAISACCRAMYGKMALTASWGLAALQSMTLGDDFEKLGDSQRMSIRNIPAKVFYGVSTDEAVALRMAGVPRSAAMPMSVTLGRETSLSQKKLRQLLLDRGTTLWTKSLGPVGADYFRAWKLTEGIAEAP